MDRLLELRQERRKLKLDKYGYHDYDEVCIVHIIRERLMSEVKKELLPLLEDENVKRYIELISEMERMKDIDSGYILPK